MVLPLGGGAPGKPGGIPYLGGQPPGGGPQPAFLAQVRKLIELAAKGCPRKCCPDGMHNISYSAPMANSPQALTRCNAASMCQWCGAYWEVTPEGEVTNRRLPGFIKVDKFETEK